MLNDDRLSITEHLHENRIVYLSGEITTAVADWVISRLLVLDSLDRDAEIRMYITSPGGSVYAGLAIYDAMQMIEAPVSTFCIGPAFSMACWLLAAGEPGRRFATPHARVMLHQASVGLGGSTTDIRIAADNMLATETMMNRILARHTGRSTEEIERAIERDLWMGPDEARRFGLVDGVAPPPERKRG